MTEGAQYKHFSEVLQCIKGKRLLRIHRAIRALAASLEPLLGRRVLRVLSVGKEIFFVFEMVRRPGQDDQALKIHFGDGPGYQYEAASGEVWGMVTKRIQRQPVAEIDLEFEGCRFRLWEDHNFFSHIYEVVDFGYVHAVEGRRRRDIANESFSKWTSEVVSLLQQKEGYIVDCVMDQTIMPGVGNIMKSEGLFNAGVHPLRRCKRLSKEELRKVVEELNRFALHWYNLCKRTGEGAPRSPTTGKANHSEGLLPKSCYGRVDCSICGEQVFCIKLGTRQRITYFCNNCQPPDDKSKGPSWRKHKSELKLRLPLCKCNAPSRMMHIYHYGHDHGRIFFACRKPRGSNGACRFRCYLDDLDFDMPKCHCRPPRPMVLRRAMGLRDNGRYFAQCASKGCKFRVWLMLEASKTGMPFRRIKEEYSDDTNQECFRNVRMECRDALEIGSAFEYSPIVPSARDLWSRHKKGKQEQQKHGTEDVVCVPPLRLFVQRAATGEFIHGREGVAQTGKHLLGVPDSKGIVQFADVEIKEEACMSGTCTPVTSGAEELLDDEAEMHPSVPDLNILYEKRWSRRMTTKTYQRNNGNDQADASACLFADRSAMMEAFPRASPTLIDDLLEEGLTTNQIIDCLCMLDT